MNDWYENKKKYITWFGDQLIYEYGHVEFHLNAERKETLIKEFLEQAGNYLNEEEFENLSTFILKNMSSFFDNIVFCDSNPAKKGMKLSKAFKYFIKDKENLDKVQQIASMYIQKDKVCGTLCLSVHPLDYLSSSENNYNWRSCHSLDGDYRAGNLSYMCDRSTIVCYIKGDKEEKLPHFPENVPWNSKKWRMLIYFDEYQDYCFLGRQYPYSLEGIFDLIQMLLPGTFREFTDYHLSKIPKIGAFYDNQIVLSTAEKGLQFFSINEVIKDEGALHFNDLIYSTVYFPYYTSRSFNWMFNQKSQPPKITVGHKVKCLYCNRSNIDYGEGLMTCCSCAVDQHLDVPDGYVVCTECGDYIDEDDCIYTHDGEILCESCANSDNYFWCDCCGDLFPIDMSAYDEKHDKLYCQDCYEGLLENRRLLNG